MLKDHPLTKSILSMLPEGLSNEIKSDINAAVQSQFERMNLVSRDEFDIQQKVLLKTRAKLDELEKTLQQLQETPPKN